MRNLLDEWFEEMNYNSSTLLIHRPKFKRADVEYIYTTLKSTFGLKFFRPNQLGMPFKKKNWLHQLLVNHEHPGCFMLLKDYTDLIEYSIKLGADYYNRLHELRQDPDNLRSYFFELFTFRMLDQNGISNTKKEIIGNKEIEGTCTFHEEKFLFECRKLYMPNLAKVDLIVDVISYIGLKVQRELKIPKGLIFTMDFPSSDDNSMKVKAQAKIDLFFKRFHSQTGNFSVEYVDPDSNIILSVTDYSIERKIELENGLGNHDIVAYVIPPDDPIPGIMLHFRLIVSGKFQIVRASLFKNLFQKVKEKNKQHSGNAYMHKVFFFDSESFPEFRMALFQKDDMLDEAEIQRQIDSGSSETILCIVHRNYFEEKPIVKLRVFCKPKYAEVKALIEKLRV